MSRTEGVAAGCAGLVKIYWAATGEVHALKGIDALFPRGAITAVVGPSGSGKSSLLRILACMDRPTAGSVIVGDTDVADLPLRKLHSIRRRLIGYVFQRPSANLVPHLTIEDHIHLAARRRSRVVDTIDLLESLGIAHRRRHMPHQISGGEQQRVAFAQAIAGSPAVVFADEPTAELDSTSARSLIDAIKHLSSVGTGFVVATHDPNVVEAADSTLHLRHGALEAEQIRGLALSVIDSSGRIQLPPEALALFPDRRAMLRMENGELRITPP